MARLELTIAADYVRWSPWEAIRELLQNAKDAEDIGYAMRVTYNPKHETLELSNQGASLTRDKLVLGSTTKRNDTRQRGQFGEGFKLAFASLIRQGFDVTADTGSERWTPCVEHSETFDTEVLVINTRAIKDRGGVTFFVNGVTKELWEEVESKCLFVRKAPIKRLAVSGGEILMDEEFRGKLYSRGLFVGHLPDASYRFGYDLHQLELDRDRRVADPWSVRAQVATTLERALEAKLMEPQDLYHMLLDNECGEANAVRHSYNWDLAYHLMTTFKELHGADAFPVTSMSEALELEHYGVMGVVVSPALASALENSMGSLRRFREKIRFTVSKITNLVELSPEERENIKWALRVLKLAGEELATWSVVEFSDPNVRGVYQDGDIKLSRSILKDRKVLIGVLVHEVAHRHGIDGSKEHVAAIQDIFGRIAASIE